MPDVGIRPWSEGDFDLLERLLGDPRMTEHLGGPESPEKLRERHQSYSRIDEPGSGQMFAVTLGLDGEAVGSVGYWAMEWQGQTVWETGFSILPEFQGQGIATAATLLTVAKAADERRHTSVHAFPSVDNGPSNTVCRKAGFTLVGEHDFEYPEGNVMRCNDWARDLPTD